MHKILTVLFYMIIALYAHGDPVSPIPLEVKYDKRKALLGKKLFFDKMLSKNYDLSCASCHDPAQGGTIHTRFSPKSSENIKANVPTVFNVVFNFRQFWNGRAKDLYEQAKIPILNPSEMALSERELEERINRNKEYKKLFKEVYGIDYITIDHVVDAIVEFEKALITPNSKFDRFLRGEIRLTKSEQEGYTLFKRLGCITCHNGVNLGGNSFQKFGVVNPYRWEPYFPDRYKVTGREEDKNVYKVPSLRNIALTYPYFHDGSAETLEEAVRKMAYHQLGINLTEDEVAKIVDFLKTLTGEMPDILKD